MNSIYHEISSSSSSSSSVDRRASRLQVAPNAHNIIFLEMCIRIDPFLDLTGKGLMRSPEGSSPFFWGGGGALIKHIDVSGFILLH